MTDFRITALVLVLAVAALSLHEVGVTAGGGTLPPAAPATRPATAEGNPDSNAIAAARQAMLKTIDTRISSLRQSLDLIPEERRTQSQTNQRLQEAILERSMIESASDAEIGARMESHLAIVPKATHSPATHPAASAQLPATTEPVVSILEAQVVFPGSNTQGRPDAQVQPPPGAELVTLRAKDGVKITALFGGAAGSAKPVLLYFYGNGDYMAHSLGVFNQFRSLGFGVLMADYEGYGMSGGTPSEPGCYAVADAAFDYLLTRTDINPHRIVAVGWSLGAGVAIDLAARRKVAGLVTFSAFTNITDMSRAILKGFPLQVPLMSRFDNLAKIRSISCPMFMAHGTQDQLVPPEMLDRLAKSAAKPPTIFHVQGANHNDIFQVGGDALFQQVKKFVDGLHDSPSTTRSNS